MDKADIPFLPASQLSQLIHDRTVSPVEAVEAYLDRIDELNPRLHAYLTVCRDEATAAARDAERALTRGESRGPLHGIPFAVKDQLNTAGIRTTSGTPIFNDFVPDHRRHRRRQAQSRGRHTLGQAEHDRVWHTRASLTPSRPPATPGTWESTPAAPAAAQAAPRRHSYAPLPWVRTPAGPSGPLPPGAGWSVSGPPGAGSAATASGRECGPWTPSAHSAAPWKTAP